MRTSINAGRCPREKQRPMHDQVCEANLGLSSMGYGFEAQSEVNRARARAGRKTFVRGNHDRACCGIRIHYS